MTLGFLSLPQWLTKCANAYGLDGTESAVRPSIKISSNLVMSINSESGNSFSK